VLHSEGVPLFAKKKCQRERLAQRVEGIGSLPVGSPIKFCQAVVTLVLHRNDRWVGDDGAGILGSVFSRG